jgi:hypothetical protein
MRIENSTKSINSNQQSQHINAMEYETVSRVKDENDLVVNCKNTGIENAEYGSYSPRIENAKSRSQFNDGSNEKSDLKISHSQEETTNNMCTSAKSPIPAYIASSHSGNNSGNDEDDGSVSSLDSSEDFPCSPSNSQRSIFGDFWNNTIHEEGSHMKRGSQMMRNDSISTAQTASITISRCSHQAVSRRYSEMTSPPPDEFAYQIFNRNLDFQKPIGKSVSDGYEEILQQNELGRTNMPRSTSLKDVADIDTLQSSSTRNARTIFKNKYSTSSPSLSSYGYKDTHVRKTSSTSSLRRKQRSILRPRSSSVDSSGLGSLQSSSSRPSVSFDSRVFVHEYEKPHERYFANGWSKLFF